MLLVTYFKFKNSLLLTYWLINYCFLSTVLCVSEIFDESQSLTPPYFNLALGRNITASATCGEDTDEVPELYCKLVGANTDTEKYNDEDVNVIQGQFCDYCDPSDPKKNHNATKAIDGFETWWQSPPLSRGSNYNDVYLTIDFGQEFHVAYVFMRMGNSPRPDVWALEKSVDYGKTYTPWQYFAGSPSECEHFFGRDSLHPILRDSSVICTTEYSQIVPLEGGEIPISLLKNRPSANSYFNSTELQEWTRATNVRLHFMRTKTLLGHLMSVARQDPTVTRRYFYSIKDISIGGRCMCNGHADTCQAESKTNSVKLICQCVHKTCGPQCAECCPNYVQKKWRQSTTFNPFVCEKCNCFNHATDCIYDPEVDRQKLSLDIHGNYDGGGVCQNCQHNTEGINCNRCIPKFYRPRHKHWNETDVCQPCNCNKYNLTGNCAESTGQCECRKEFKSPLCNECNEGYYGYPDCKPCDCHLNGTRSKQCEADNGVCQCKHNFFGPFCDTCAKNYYNFPECLPCECNSRGSSSPTCNITTGNCTCHLNYQGRMCNECSDGYYDYPSCNFCNCDKIGTEPGVCDKTNGKCLCKHGYGGERCDSCIPGYFGYPNCQPCNCSEIGSTSPVCDASGTCSCLRNFASRTCEQCSPGFYKYPECLYCNCFPQGSNGISCDNQGRCQCHNNFNGDQCNTCKDGFYNFPICEECNCNPAGVVPAFAGCGSVPAGQLCECKERVQGRICDRCKPLYWNLHPNNPDGCEECTCHIPGVMGGMAVCDSTSGQCVCKPSVISKDCRECKDGTYNLQETNLFGCTDCGCDIGGSVSNICDKQSGQCECHPRVQGKLCDRPMQTHFFPTLYQYQFEVEDGFTARNNKVRFGFFDDVFPNFSWKGYGIFSDLQKEIKQNIYIHKPSLYRMVLRYINTNQQDVSGRIEIDPDNPSDSKQEFTVVFKPTSTPAFVTVAGLQGITPSPFVMNPGVWTVTLKINKYLLVDYFVLIPTAFYEATILTRSVDSPCIVGQQNLCRHYNYPNISEFNTVNGVGGFISSGDERGPLREYHTDFQHLKALNENEIPMLNTNQPEVNFDATINKPGKYVLVINYLTPLNDNRTYDLSVETSDSQERIKGRVILYACPYTTLCRQVVTDKEHRVAIFNVNSNNIRIALKGRDNPNIGIKSIVFIPFDQWSLDYIQPKSVCVRKDGVCVRARFPIAPNSKKVQVENGNEELISKILPSNIYRNTSQLIQLNNEEPMVDVLSKVPQPGTYVFVVHYYQPHYPEFNVDVVIHNGQVYEGKVLVRHCPSSSGCRAVVTLNNGDRANIVLTDNFVITFKSPTDKTVWLDFVLAIPVESYSDKVLYEDKFDQTGEFISTCGKNHFYIDTSETGFCRDAVFSLTTAYNNGALPCKCDFDGSLSFDCETFGGQCPCKPNIIGRKCEICKPGYYGFPDCQPCNCPSTAFCEPNTGECICLPHVTGPNCDQCEPLSYGYDLSIGCEECKCDPLGVLNGDLQCDLLTGNCQCKPNIIDRTCSRCEAGYYSFPYCEECECDLRGTTDDVCDLETAECFCKENVYGHACDVCQDGSFNLQLSNPHGCTKCFCFGKTTRCISSNYYRVQIQDMEDWLLYKLEGSEDDDSGELDLSPLLTLPEKHDIREQIYYEIRNNYEDSNTIVYLAAPISYLGNQLTAYGGIFEYTVVYYSQTSGEATTNADLILKGADIMLMYSSPEQPTSGVNFTVRVEIVEQNFNLPNGAPATRENIMLVLENLVGIYIRTNYWNQSISTSIHSISMDVATPQFLANSTIAEAVEHCQCPPNYVGSSCEKCAPGYYRIDTGPYGGYCVQCQCNGHSQECDVNTGICFNCQHNTTGDHCEKCEIGFHGDATTGTARDCLICACPVPTASNNFAESCDVSDDGNWISCQCKEGYTGSRCQGCSTGYYGQPEVLGDYCKPCNCSGNINAAEIGACDTVSGECLKCLHNTFGKVCELCRPGFYGDAIHQKNCQRCDCDEIGLDFCDNADGTCHCKPNVVGDKCDRCADNHYGFESGIGCLPCECGPASVSSQCDPISGQCRCQPGVTGRTCENCISGFWNYTESGCISCGCHSEYSKGVGCNELTGECQCLKDVKGGKCDHCEHRWVFIPDYGCYESDSCVHDLLDTTDAMKDQLDTIIDQFKTMSTNYFTYQRLTYINSTVDQLTPRVAKLDPNRIDLNVINNRLESIDQNTKNLNQKTEFALQNINKSINDANDIRKRADSILAAVKETSDFTYKTIVEVREIGDRLETGSSVQLDPAIKRSQALLDEINTFNFTEALNHTEKQLDKSKRLLAKMANFSEPSNNQSFRLDKLRHQANDFDVMLNNLTEYAYNVREQANKVEQMNERNKMGQNTNLTKVNLAEQSNINIETKLNSSEILMKNATNYHNSAKNTFDSLFSDELELMRLKNTLNHTYLNNERDIEDVRNNLRNAENYKDELINKANQLSQLLNDSQVDTRVEDAVNAANAYKTISSDVTQALDDVQAAEAFNANATSLLDGLQDFVRTSDSSSQQLATEASDLLAQLQKKYEPRLEDAKQNVDDIEQKLKDANVNLTNINNSANFRTPPFDDIVGDANNKSEIANATALSTSGLINELNENLLNDLDEAKQLPKVYDDASKEVTTAKEELNKIYGVLPNLKKLMENMQPSADEDLNRQNDLLNIQNKILKLDRMIAEARDEINRINVGVEFYRNSTLQLKNPPNLGSMSTSTKASFYFQTANPNGFLFYLGNENGTKLRQTNSDDFMAIEIENGYPVLTMDLGSGPKKIINDKYVADNEWYQIKVDRIGKNVKLTVVEETPDKRFVSHEKDAKLEGSNSIFNLNRDQSKLFVGGYPVSSKLQLQNSQAAFEGKIEELKIGDQEISLWNFVEGSNLHGAHHRDKLEESEPTGFRFGGKGYIKLDAQRYTESDRFALKINIKTDSTDGLIFLLGTDDMSYLALELRNGFVTYQYKLDGNQPAFVQSKVRVNDNKWHVIEVGRYNQNGRLGVDNEHYYNLQSTGKNRELEQFDYMYFGGYPGQHKISSVMNVDFNGCIDDVNIKSIQVEFSKQLEAFDVVPGCPIKFYGTVSFDKNSPGFVRYPNATTGRQFEITLTISTLQSDGLIFYTTNELQNDTLSLSLVNGNLILRNKNTALSTSSIKFNDGERYVITATHDAKELKIIVNDYEHFAQRQDLPARKLTYKYIYFGGIPTNILVPENILASRAPFAGCIEDVTLNGAVINFANVIDKQNGILDTCSTTAVLEKTDVYQSAPKPSEITTHYEFIIPEETTLYPTTTTTTESTTRTYMTLPPQIEKCALPLDPEETTGYDSGYRFGTMPHSRIEFDNGALILNSQNQINITFEIKLDDSDDAVLFYAANRDHSQFIALRLYESKVELRLKIGDEMTSIVHDRPLNDGQWHKISSYYYNQETKLSVDDDQPFTQSVPPDDDYTEFNAQAPFYFGGTSPQVGKYVVDNLETNNTFAGCLRNFKYNDRLLSISRAIAVIPCSEQVENGIYFTREGGYVKLDSKFTVGIQMNVQLEIRPRHHTGVILSVHGRRDYLILSLKDGDIIATVNNGEGPFSSSFKPNSPHFICNGNWHTVQVLKSKNVVTVAVDNVFALSANRGSQKKTNTKHGLFIGGHPHLARLSGFNVTREHFIGCMRNVHINDKLINIRDKPAYHGVRFSVCPTN